MRKLIAVAVAGLILASAFTGGANARPAYKTEFEGKYEKVKENNKIDCGVCHPKMDKKVRNNYGEALGKVIAKNEKDKEKIREAMGKVEKEKSATEGKTFGDLLGEGKLPGKNEE